MLSVPAKRAVFTLCGLILLSHFVYVLCRNFYRGTPEDIFWLSHIATLVGGIGALLQNRFLISVALVSCFGYHLFWIFDTAAWFMTGIFPIGATVYVKDNTPGGWIQSSNHFFVIPLLFVCAVLSGGIERRAWIWASLLFVLLVAVSVAFLPAESNINSALKPWGGFESLTWLFISEGHFYQSRYLLILVLVTVFCNFLPVNIFLSFLVSRIIRLIS